ncbi:MAG: hypothetical protein ACE5EG_11145, partial [Thermoanaerobaculia bacterium]
RRTTSADGGPPPVLLPTEILHALYDGGGGASLDDYWRLLRSSGRLGGAFLWSLFDEGVVRTDREGRIDTGGNRGADGLLGPHRQPEASYHTVREVWSPLQIASYRYLPETVEVELENHFDETDLAHQERVKCAFDLAQCTLRWRWLAFPRLPEDGLEVRAMPGGERPLPAAAPGTGVVLSLPRPEVPGAVDAVELRAFAPDGREVMVWVLPDPAAQPIAEAWKGSASSGGPEVRIEQEGSHLTLRSATGKWAEFDLDSGGLLALGDGAHRLPLAGGAQRAGGGRARLVATDVEPRTRAIVVRSRYRGALDEATWTFYANGMLRLDYGFQDGGEDAGYLGVGFDGLADRVGSLTWLGMGPYRVWRNRLAGGRLGIWRTEWNETMTGVEWRYPELPGFYAGVRWARLATDQGTLILAPDPGLFLGVLEPRFPAGARTAVAAVPAGITVLHQISAMGTKFHRPEALGPSARRMLRPGVRRGGVWLSFSAGGAADP